MSIIIIAFPAAPKVSNSAIKRDSEISEMLKKRVQGKATIVIVWHARKKSRCPNFLKRPCFWEKENYFVAGHPHVIGRKVYELIIIQPFNKVITIALQNLSKNPRMWIFRLCFKRSARKELQDCPRVEEFSRSKLSRNLGCQLGPVIFIFSPFFTSFQEAIFGRNVPDPLPRETW